MKAIIALILILATGISWACGHPPETQWFKSDRGPLPSVVKIVSQEEVNKACKKAMAWWQFAKGCAVYYPNRCVILITQKWLDYCPELLEEEELHCHGMDHS